LRCSTFENFRSIAVDDVASHKKRLVSTSKPRLLGKRAICLNIPDNDKFMDPALIQLL